MITEGKFQKDVKKLLELTGAVVLNVHGGKFQKAGWPDLQVYSPRWTGHLELKVLNRKLRPLQSRVIKSLIERETNAYCLREDKDGDLSLEDHNGEILAMMPGFKSMSPKLFLCFLMGNAVCKKRV